MQGRMMDFPLTITQLLERAERYFSNVEVVSTLPDRSRRRVTYGETAVRARRLASALTGLGVSKGQRVATLSWNHQQHLEAYLAIPAMGAVPLFFGALIGLVTGRISHKNLSLLDLLTEISTPESLRRRPKLKIARVNLSLGVLTAIAGGAILIIIGGVPWEDQKNLARFLWFSDAVVVFGFFLLGLSRNYLQFDMDSLLSADTREPILFLRSFKDDELGEYNASQRSFLDYSLETRLATHFVRAGPFIAVRDPSVAILLPGAARKVLPDSEWKNQVVEWIAAASVIVMYAGKTDSLQWELRKVIEVGKVPNLILMTPEAMILKHPSEAGVRFEHIKTAFSETKWAPALAALPSAKSIRALIFKPDGTAVVVTSRKTNRDSWHLAALIAHFILRENASGVGVTRSATDKNQLLQR